MHRTLIVLAVGLMTIGSGSRASGPARLAIISGPAAQSSSLAELLTVELSTADGVELVERDAIQAVAGELALTKALGAAAVADRRNLGTALKADTLVCLDDAPDDNGVRVVVCDTRSGARLGAVVVPAAGKNTPAVAPVVAEYVNGVRGRFPNGVTAVIGLSSFACGNLTHEYDHLGRTYADLLADALTTARPGLAVLEIDEARAIAAEQNLAGGTMSRFTPAVVDGEYTVSRNDRDTAIVTLQAKVTAGKDEPTVSEKPGVPLADAGAFLRVDVATAVLSAVAGDGGPISTDRQFALLVARADRFARTGAFATSTRLREAAILLKPDAYDQRLKLIREYPQQIWLDYNWHAARTWRRRPGSIDKTAIAREIRITRPWAVDGRHALGHLEALVRARHVSLKDALILYRTAEGMFGPYVRAAGGYEMDVYEANLAARRGFARHVLPKMIDLPMGDPIVGGRFVPYAHWEAALLAAALSVPDRQGKLPPRTVPQRHTADPGGFRLRPRTAQVPAQGQRLPGQVTRRGTSQRLDRLSYRTTECQGGRNNGTPAVPGY